MFQEKFINEAIKRFELLNARRVSTPIELSALENIDSPLLMDKRLYQSIVGVINWIVTTTRPDGAFGLGILARRMQNPTNADLRRAKRMLVYFRDTSTYGIPICGEQVENRNKAKLEVFVDSSYANGSDRRSIFGYIILLDGNIIAYKSKLEANCGTIQLRSRIYCFNLFY